MAKLKKLFVSQPMMGRTDNEILAEREKIRQEMEEEVCEPVELVDSFFTDHNLDPLECLGESLKLMAKADVVYFASGWQRSRGCMVEYMAAGTYGKDIYTEEYAL